MYHYWFSWISVLLLILDRNSRRLQAQPSEAMANSAWTTAAAQTASIWETLSRQLRWLFQKQSSNYTSEHSFSGGARHPSTTGSTADVIWAGYWGGDLKVVVQPTSKSCSLDPVPTWFLKQLTVPMVSVICRLCNLSLQTGLFPSTLKHALVHPRIKKPRLDPGAVSNYRPISNLSYFI